MICNAFLQYWLFLFSISAAQGSSDSTTISGHKNDVSAEECTICLQPMTTQDSNNVVCQNGHSCFHNACISRWLGNSMSCPICRQYIAIIPVSILPQLSRLGFSYFSNLNDPTKAVRSGDYITVFKPCENGYSFIELLNFFFELVTNTPTDQQAPFHKEHIYDILGMIRDFQIDTPALNEHIIKLLLRMHIREIAEWIVLKANNYPDLRKHLEPIFSTIGAPSFNGLDCEYSGLWLQSRHSEIYCRLVCMFGPRSLTICDCTLDETNSKHLFDMLKMQPRLEVLTIRNVNFTTPLLDVKLPNLKKFEMKLCSNISQPMAMRLANTLLSSRALETLDVDVSACDVLDVISSVPNLPFALQKVEIKGLGFQRSVNFGIVANFLRKSAGSLTTLCISHGLLAKPENYSELIRVLPELKTLRTLNMSNFHPQAEYSADLQAAISNLTELVDLALQDGLLGPYSDASFQKTFRSLTKLKLVRLKGDYSKSTEDLVKSAVCIQEVSPGLEKIHLQITITMLNKDSVLAEFGKRSLEKISKLARLEVICSCKLTPEESMVISQSVSHLKVEELKLANQKNDDLHPLYTGLFNGVEGSSQIGTLELSLQNNKAVNKATAEMIVKMENLKRLVVANESPVTASKLVDFLSTVSKSRSITNLAMPDHLISPAVLDAIKSFASLTSIKVEYRSNTNSLKILEKFYEALPGLIVETKIAEDE